MVVVERLDLINIIRQLSARNGEIIFLKTDIERAELEPLEQKGEENLFDSIRLTATKTHEKISLGLSQKYPVRFPLR